MPLNCLPATTSVEALEAKRAAAAGQCTVDWAAWGGVSGGNADQIAPLAAAGVRGFKCFLAEPGIDGFARVDEAELRRALPSLAQTGLPLLVHAESRGSSSNARASALNGADWQLHKTWLTIAAGRGGGRGHSPDDRPGAGVSASACTSCIWPRTRRSTICARRRQKDCRSTVETCPHYLYFAAEEIAKGCTQYKCAPPIRGPRKSRTAVAGAGTRRDRSDRDGSFALSAGVEGAREWQLCRSVGRHCQHVGGAERGVDLHASARLHADRCSQAHGGKAGGAGRIAGTQGKDRSRLRRGFGGFRSG